MGRRKSKRKPPPKKKMTGNLDTQFTCPFCNHEKSCDVKMERTRNTGIISCSVCLEEFQTPITCILLKKVLQLQLFHFSVALISPSNSHFHPHSPPLACFFAFFKVTHRIMQHFLLLKQEIQRCWWTRLTWNAP
uniref:Transcription elongation factor 1 homolog n=1 Tax=Stegastes partitus TaxID=144197 RepID=A0A3B5AP05_9TELE